MIAFFAGLVLSVSIAWTAYVLGRRRGRREASETFMPLLLSGARGWVESLEREHALRAMLVALGLTTGDAAPEVRH